MKKILFFEPDLTGHRIEYIHHEVMGAAMRSGLMCVFVVPQDFAKFKESFIWPNAANVSFIFLTEKEQARCNQPNRAGKIWAVSRTIRKYARLERPDHIFMNTLVDGMPFIPFMLPSKTSLSGIVYGSFYWLKGDLSRLKYMYYSFIYRLFRKHKAFSRILLVNDESTACRLNSMWSTSRFACLPDPITNIDRDKVRDIRAEYGISADKTVYLLFPIAQRKHVLDILRAIDTMDASELKDKAFIFTGKLDKEIQDEFHNMVKSLSGKCQIVTVEGIIPYEMLFNFCYSADVYFTLYDNYHMSSGVLGYCAYFNKSVISINKGLLGQIVRSYGMGLCIDRIDTDSIVGALRAKPSKCHSDYVDTHTIERFNQVIFSAFS